MDLDRDRDAELALDLRGERPILGPAAEQGRRRESLAARIAGRGELRARAIGIERREEVLVASTRDAGRDHAGCRDRGPGRAQPDQPAPVDGPGEGLAHANVVERRSGRVEAVVLERQVVRAAQL